MFILIWATLLFSVRSSSADNVSSPGGEQTCQNKSNCILEANLTAEAGRSVVIQCSFTAPAGFHAKSVIFYKCDGAKPKCGEPCITTFNSSDNSMVQPGFEGQVSMMKPTLNQSNCSIIINESDSASYEIRVVFIKDNSTSTSRANITVTAAGSNKFPATQKPTVMTPPVTEGRQITPNCTAPCLCCGCNPKITWTWRGARGTGSQIEGNITDVLLQTSNRHGTEVIYTFSLTRNKTTEETVTLNVTCSGPGWISTATLDLLTQLLQIVKDWKVITAFLFGMLLSAIICCLAGICCRKKQRRSENLAENLEMVTTQAVPLIDDGQPMEDNDGSHYREAAEGGPEAADQSAPDGDMEPKEVEYSDIDFTMLKMKSPTGAEETQEPIETEYAEIKKEAAEARQDDGGEEGEALEEAMIGEDRVTEECMPAKEEEGEDVALYSNVDEIMREA